MKQIEFSFDDPKTLDLFKKGDLDYISGIIVKDSNGMYELTHPLQYYKQINDLTYEDIIVINGIYDKILFWDNSDDDSEPYYPAYLMKQFIRRRNGEEQLDYFHPSLKPILEITHGIYVFREQLHATAMIIGELSIAEAEYFVREIGKGFFNKSNTIHAKFFENTNKKFLDSTITDRLFEEMKKCLFIRLKYIEPLAKELYSVAWVKANYRKNFERNPREVRRIVRVSLFKENDMSKFWNQQNYLISIFGSENIEKTNNLLSTIQINNKSNNETFLSPLSLYNLYCKSGADERQIWQFFVTLYVFYNATWNKPEKAIEGSLLQQVMIDRVNDEVLNMNFSDDLNIIGEQIKNKINEVTHEVPVQQSTISKVDIEKDFITFGKQMQNKYGEINDEQTELLFERAINDAKKNLPYSAIIEARLAYGLSQFAKGNGNPLYILGFLTEIHIEINKFKKAQSYLNICYELLDSNDPDYANEKAKFDEMQDIINGEMWKDTDFKK